MPHTTPSNPTPPATPLAQVALLMILVAGLFVAPARAAFTPQQPTDAANPGTPGKSVADSKRLDLRVRVGFQSLLIPERWTPLWVDLTPPPGETSQGGTLVVEYEQDATQNTRIVLDVATTPGRTSRICVPVCVPNGVPKITVTFRPDEGRPVTYRMGNRSDDDVSAPLPSIADPGGLHVAVAGNVPLLAPMALSRWVNQNRQASFNVFSTMQNCGAEALPPVASAYEGLNLLVVRAELARTLEPRVLAAIRHWVASGGRLVIAAWEPGDAWRNWLPPGENGDLVRLGEARPGDISESLNASLVQRARQIDAISRAAPPNAVQVAPAQPGVPLVVPAKPPEQWSAADRPQTNIPQRPLSLTPASIRAGWALRWTIDPPEQSGGDSGNDPDAGAGNPAPGRGLIAEGPVGLGFVAIIGINPANIVSTPSTVSVSAAYESAFLGILADMKVASNVPDDSSGWYSLNGSGAGRTSQHAIRHALDSLSEAPPAPIGLFWLIGASMAVLALLLGPGDYFLLGFLRRSIGGLRHRSHITALLWIGVASAVSYIGPATIRSSESRVRRLSVIDAVMPAGGAAGIARQTSLTGVWAGSSADAAFIEPGEGDATARSAPGWWRGVSPLSGYRGGGESFALDTVTYTQRAAQVASNDPVWGGYARGAEGASTLQTAPDGPPDRRGGFALANWTFRALEDSTAVSLPVRTRVIRTGGRIEVVVDGVPAGATPGITAVRTGSTWLKVDLKPDGTRSWRGLASADTSERSIRFIDNTLGLVNALEWTFDPQRVETNSANMARYGWGDWGEPWSVQGSALNMADSQRRGLACEARLKSGNWAIVYLTLNGMPPDVRITRPAKAIHERTAVIRIATPVEERAGGSPAPAPGDPATPSPTSSPTPPGHP